MGTEFSTRILISVFGNGVTRETITMGWPYRENEHSKDTEKDIKFKIYRNEIRLLGSVLDDSEEIGKKLKRKDSEK
jgi:hypothetical protein